MSVVTYGEKLKKARQKRPPFRLKRVTGDEVALACVLDPAEAGDPDAIRRAEQRYRSYEGDKAVPSREIQLRIAAYHGIAVTWFHDGRDTPRAFVDDPARIGTPDPDEELSLVVQVPILRVDSNGIPLPSEGERELMAVDTRLVEGDTRYIEMPDDSMGNRIKRGERALVRLGAHTPDGYLAAVVIEGVPTVRGVIFRDGEYWAIAKDGQAPVRLKSLPYLGPIRAARVQLAPGWTVTEECEPALPTERPGLP
jgi:hypothetical protein